MFQVIWYVGHTECFKCFKTRADAESFIADSAMDPDEFDIIEEGVS